MSPPSEKLAASVHTTELAAGLTPASIIGVAIRKDHLQTLRRSRAKPCCARQRRQRRLSDVRRRTQGGRIEGGLCHPPNGRVRQRERRDSAVCRNPQVQPCFLKSRGLYRLRLCGERIQAVTANRHTASSNIYSIKNASTANRYRVFPDSVWTRSGFNKERGSRRQA